MKKKKYPIALQNRHVNLHCALLSHNFAVKIANKIQLSAFLLHKVMQNANYIL